MPSYLRNKKRDVLTFVKANANNVYYGWNAKDITSLPGITTTDIAALGHLAATSAKAISGSLCVLGAKAPRPPRVKKILAANTTSPDVQESASTFCGYDKLSTALTENWKPAGRGRGVAARQTSRSITAAAAISFGGSLVGYYLFPMNASDALLPEVALLGLQFAGTTLSAAEIAKGFSASSYPKPAKVILTRSDGSNISTFCSFDKITDAISGGWAVIEGSPPPVVHDAVGGP